MCLSSIHHGLHYNTLATGTSAMLRRDVQARGIPVLSHESRVKEQYGYTSPRTAKRITIPTEKQSPVVVVTPECGLMTVRRIQAARSKQCILPTRISEVCKNVPFCILVTIFLTRPVSLNKYICIAKGTGPPELILDPIETENQNQHLT